MGGSIQTYRAGAIRKRPGVVRVDPKDTLGSVGVTIPVGARHHKRLQPNDAPNVFGWGRAKVGSVRPLGPASLGWLELSVGARSRLNTLPELALDENEYVKTVYHL